MLIFVVEDDPFYAELLQYYLGLNPEDEVKLFTTGRACLENLYQQPQVICLDFSLPDTTGEDLLRKIKERYPAIPVIIVSAQKDLKTAVGLMKLGAADYIVKDKDTKDTLWQSLTRLRRQLLQAQTKGHTPENYPPEKQLIGRSAGMVRVNSLLEKAANSRITVTISGEAGTGKELAAKSIHYTSARRLKPLVIVNLAAIPPALLERELFGYERGSTPHTGPRRKGQLERAHTGTLILNEVSELPLNLQAKLLRTLQEREIIRPGATRRLPLDVRLIVTTTKNLSELVQTEKFREDLYYRLLGLTIELPPLRERNSDILLLANKFIAHASAERAGAGKRLSTTAQKSLLNYPWPGNVRELKSVSELACLLAEKEVIEPEHLQFNEATVFNLLAEEHSLEEYTTRIIRYYLDKYDRNVLLVAKKLKVGKSTLYRYIQANKV